MPHTAEQPNNMALIGMNSSRKGLKIVIVCQSIVILWGLYVFYSGSSEVEPEVITRVLYVTPNISTTGSSSADTHYVYKKPVECKPQDYTTVNGTLAAAELASYAFGVMMQKRPPPYLPNYDNPCWMETEGTLRCVPSIILAGITKCGTSELFRNFVLHPHIRQGYDKEINFWQANAKGNTFAKYAHNFQAAVKDIGHMCLNASGRIYHHMRTIDASPATAFDYTAFQSHPANQGQSEPKVLAPHVIMNLMPHSKSIIILRNPVTRLYSEFLFFHARSSNSKVNPEDFHNHVQKSVTHYRNCFKQHSVRECAYLRAHTSKESMIRAYVGFYDVFIRDWMEAIPRDQLYILRLEDYSLDKVGEMRKIYQFLGLDDLPPEIYEEIRNANKQNARRAHAQSIGDMQLRTRKLLQEFYSPHNRRLADLMNDERYTWGY